MPIYMNYEGISGSVTAKGFEKNIELESCQIGQHRTTNSSTGNGANREASTPQISEIVITKSLDQSSNSLFRETLSGKGKKVKIVFVNTGNVPYLTIELENVLISSYSVSGHGGGASNDRPTESLSLNFTKITFTAGTEGNLRSGQPNRVDWKQP